jgi:uncharacterized membrane protein
MMASPFDLRSVLTARHAQHVVLIHFPIALFLTGVAFDLAARWKRSAALAAAAYYDLMLAAVSTLPVVVTGLLAWRWQLEGARLKGNLLLHLVLGVSSGLVICLSWWLHFRGRRRPELRVPRYSLALEIAGAMLVALTGHLGGFLSGVNS